MWRLCGVTAVDFGDCGLSGFRMGHLGDLGQKWPILQQIFWRGMVFGSNSGVGQIWPKCLGLHGYFGVNIPCLTDQGENKFDSIFSARVFGLKRVVGENCVVVHFQNSYFWLCTLAQTGLVIRCSSSKGLGFLVGRFGAKKRVWDTFGQKLFLGKIGFGAL